MNPIRREPPRYNEFGQPIGAAIARLEGAAISRRTSTLTGRYCRLEPLDAARHARELFEAQAEDQRRQALDLPVPRSVRGIRARIEQWCIEAQASRDPQFYAIVDAATGRAVGIGGLHAHRAASRCHRGRQHLPRAVGWRRSRAATEAIYLFIANAFALGYRRFEWKCDSCNLPSRAAATRFGFTYEGLFRQAIVNKGRNRDTTWFAIIDVDWKRGLQDAYLRWLDPGEFRRRGPAEAAVVRS